VRRRRRQRAEEGDIEAVADTLATRQTPAPDDLPQSVLTLNMLLGSGDETNAAR
jgi:hypothetical protein